MILDLEASGTAGSEGTGTLKRAVRVSASGSAGSKGFAYFELALGQPCPGVAGAAGAGFLDFQPPEAPAMEDVWFYGATSVKDMVAFGAAGSAGEAELYT